MAVEGTVREVAVGDSVEVGRHRVGDAARVGEVVRVLGAPGRRHYVIRWHDGHESIVFPGSDTRITPGPDRQPTKKKQAAARGGAGGERRTR